MSQLRVKVFFEKGMAEFSGTVEDVTRNLLKFLTELYPGIKLVQNLSLSLDLEEASEALKGLIAIHPEPVILADTSRLTLSERCLLVLITKYLAYMFGKSDNPSMSLEELSRQVVKSKKTLSARLSELMDRQLVEKLERGTYKVTLKGFKTFISDIAPKLRVNSLE